MSETSAAYFTGFLFGGMALTCLFLLLVVDSWGVTRPRGSHPEDERSPKEVPWDMLARWRDAEKKGNRR